MLEKNSLDEVLGYTKCTELPKPLKKTDVFVRGIALVRKLNNRESYCIVVNDGTGKPLVKKTFGSISVIKEVLEIYPLSTLAASVVPDFRKKQDVIDFLVRCGENRENVEKMFESGDADVKAKIKSLVYKYCINHQLRREQQEAKLNAKPLPESPAAVENKETKNEENNEREQETKEPTGETGGEEKATGSDF
ncbi:MAG: hypothetical protein KBT34_02780 [Prevotella sp.]|nr:hypothetical protein [Candidatus Prevotella equi]